MSRREAGKNNVDLRPIINGKNKFCRGHSDQQPLWTFSICIVLRMIYWFIRLCLGLLCKALCDIYSVSEPNLFVSVTLLRPDLVVSTHDFHSSNSRMINRASEKNPLTISTAIFWWKKSILKRQLQPHPESINWKVVFHSLECCLESFDLENKFMNNQPTFGNSYSLNSFLQNTLFTFWRSEYPTLHIYSCFPSLPHPFWF